MNKAIRIGTRKSELALKQAHMVGQSMANLQLDYEIVTIDSKGDLDLITPLYQLGITGVFTKTLDIALLEERIDIAVHSLKDVPTLLPQGIKLAAVLERDHSADVLVKKNNEHLPFSNALTIATGSIRRKAQWLHKYPSHTVCGLRGNVNTRLKKLSENDWHGAIFSTAGLERIQMLPEHHMMLDWMVPAPAQGVVAIAALERHSELCETIYQLNHFETEITSSIERDFLNELEGGCSAPIGAFAKVEGEVVSFHGRLNSIDGKAQIDINEEISLNNIANFGRYCAKELLSRGGKEIMDTIKSQ